MPANAPATRLPKCVMVVSPILRPAASDIRYMPRFVGDTPSPYACRLEAGSSWKWSGGSQWVFFPTMSAKNQNVLAATARRYDASWALTGRDFVYGRLTAAPK